MLYFISSTVGLKIGVSDSILTRLATINTSSPHPCKVVLTLEVPNQKQVETQLHEALAGYRMNGEWFEVSFSKAFQALVALNVISDPFPKMDLLYPDRITPPMDEDFPYWWMGINSLEEAYEQDVKSAWKEEREEFLEYRRQGLAFEEMISRGKKVREETLRDLREGAAALRAKMNQGG